MAEKTDDFVGNGAETAVLEEKAAKMTGKLQKRDDERVADITKRKEQKESSSAAHENATFFATQFSTVCSQVESGLEKSESVDKNKLADHFDNLLLEVQKMNKFLTESTMFLPPYQVQKAQETVAKLQSAVQEKRDKLLPKKKFAFRAKKKVADKPAEDVTKTEKKPLVQVNITDCSFANVKSQTLEKMQSEIKQQDVALTRLEDCTVKLYGSPSAVHINNLKNCKVFSGPVSGSIFIDDCTDCVFVMACQQLRIHTTTNSHFYIHVTSRAIIEDCSTVEFAPYNWQYQDLDSHYQTAGLDRARNTWDDVDDFNWLASDKHSPNWNILDEKKRVAKWET